MHYAKVVILLFFSLLIGLMTTLRPLASGGKKVLSTENQTKNSCPTSDCDFPTDEETSEETNEEDSEWDDEIVFLLNDIFKVYALAEIFSNFTYLVLNPEPFSSICIPPPEQS